MMEMKIKEHTLQELEDLYSEAEQCDKEVFAEMRSNLLLISGDHYKKRNSEFFKRIQSASELTDQQKIRLTKNHVQKIHKTQCNIILAAAPGVGFQPKNENEIQDQKAAELHEAVWRDAEDKYNLAESTDEWVEEFNGIGEVATKIFYDPSIGSIVGYHQQVDELGQPVADEMGNPVPDMENPKFQGGWVFEDVQGFNLLRAPSIKKIKKSPYLIIRKMVDVKKLKNQFPQEEKKISATQDRTFLVFDSQKAGYRQSKDECLVKEFYFRPCPQYPNGYFYISIETAILDKGELPGGVFPIVWQYCDQLPTTPRGVSPVKTMRPYQMEINRAGSKIAEHQITLGDDKLLIQDGTKISAGVALPGVRSVNYRGVEPGILQGRAGTQYLEYMNSQITELYRVMNVPEALEDEVAQIDPYALLYRAASQKKKFKRYIARFERFQKEVVKTFLKLAKIHMSNDEIVYAVGRAEAVNIPEFKNAQDICYQIKVTEQAEDVEGKLGKQLVLNNILQYIGPQLQKDDIGKLIRIMPYVNEEEAFSDFTLDYDSARNDILALDRGELPPIHEYDDHIYIVKKLVSRKRQADFPMLSPEIQQNYDRVIQQHEQAAAMQAEKIQRAKDGFIPTDGYMVTCDLYVSDPADPTKTRRARLPYRALDWLIKQLEVQGKSLEQLEGINQGALAEMAGMMSSQNSPKPLNGMSGNGIGAEMPGGNNNGTNQSRGWLSGGFNPGPKLVQ